MPNNRNLIITTVASSLSFCLLIIFVSLSPLSELGRNANQFNSFGMWLAISITLLLFFVPLMLYLTGLNWMIYVMAICFGIGIIMLLFTMLVVILIGAITGMLSSLIAILIFCGIGCIANIIWFFIAF